MTRSTTRAGTVAAALSLALALSACERATPGAAAAADRPAASQAMLTAEADWRAERRARLLAEDGWTSLIGLHWVELRAHYLGSDATSGIRLAKGPPKLGLVQRDGERIYFTPERNVAVTLDGAPIKGRAELRDDQADAPSLLGFDDGKGALTVIRRGPRKALRVRHADAATRTGFGSIEYWPVDPGWLVDARFRVHPAGRTIDIASITGGVEAMANPGVVEFEREGETYRLEALDGGEGGLFLILADRTNGHGSYGAGRYLDVAAPDAQGRVSLNFNRAYNPPCAFTAFATCPLPPPENRLGLAVTAGEMAYAAPVN
ncbi:DUF1684 domain-containing protein [Luteimonas sp. MC1825]|uniref:DUF1684 domain-containing protein n=1 Tax=Luteimonas sp. MC1825 TaxID=2761107 RepID=UPI00160DB93E|nr:DUF1684 domain-containing protein [Luteimonas sp. MC1825]MBB6598962.1 DUF1684 domain-containing protein [Luteimonas sp. MC1825]QOC89101.1 DUF1684 domain-containing protein [Luteimonas sp. MC1825]